MFWKIKDSCDRWDISDNSDSNEVHEISYRKQTIQKMQNIDIFHYTQPKNTEN